MLTALTNIRHYQRNPIAFLQEKLQRHGDVFDFRIGNLPVTFFADPRDIEQIYTHPKAFQRSKLIRVIRPITGDSILVSTGEAWKKKRLAAQPVFQPGAIAALGELMVRIVEKHLDRWAKASGPIDLRKGSVDLTLEIVTEALFGQGIDSLPSEFHRDMESIFDALRAWAENPLSLPQWVPIARHRRFNRAMKRFNSLTYGFIDGYIERGGEGSALLAILLRSLRAADGTFDREAARNEVITYFLAGFETTASTLSWAIYELARKPEYAERVREEIRERGVSNLTALQWPMRIQREALRLHPPAWFADFEATEDSTVGNQRVAKGSHLWISQYITHRHPGWWKDADEFKPERFNEEEDRKRHKYAFFPFGAGARHCIGQGFATLELQAAIALLCQRFRWKLADETPVPERPGFVLRPGTAVNCVLSPI